MKSQIDDSCMICARQFNRLKQKPVVLCQGNHTICYECASEIKRRQENNTTCPFCKRPYQMKNISPNRQYLQKLKPQTLAELQKQSFLNLKIGNYVIDSLIEKGQIAEVYKAFDDRKKIVVSVKIVNLQQFDKKNLKINSIQKKLSETEPKLMFEAANEHVVKFIQTYQNNCMRILVMQYCNGGTLEDFIRNNKQISQNTALSIFLQIVAGLNVLHSKKIMHRNLKSSNIFICDGVFKIGSFFFSKKLDECSQAKQETVGTLSTMAPQVLKREPYGIKADIWSLGMILIEMLTGKLPYGPLPISQMIEQVSKINTIFDHIPCSQQTKKLLRELLSFEPEKRINCQSILNLNYLRNVVSDINFDVADKRFSKKLEAKKEEKRQERKRKCVPQIMQKTPKINQTPQVQQLTLSEFQQKKKQLSYFQQWNIDSNLHCQKTEWILRFIIQPLQKILPNNDRGSVEFFYLLSSRCLMYISPVKDKLKNTQSYILQTVQQLYEQSVQKLSLYSGRLTQIQNKIYSMMSDRFFKTFKSAEYIQKDKFMGGIENTDFSRDQQIKYTADKYIPQILQKIKPKKSQVLSDQVLGAQSNLLKYQKVNKLTVKDIYGTTFEKVVAKII